MPTAERDIAVVAPHFDLPALGQGGAVFVHANDHRRLAPAVADRPHLAQFVRQRQQRSGAGKQLAPEIDPQPIGHDRYVQVVDGARQLPDLFARQPLRFVQQDAGDRTFGQPGLDHGVEIRPARPCVGFSVDANATGDAPLARTVVEIRGQQIGLHSTFDVIVGRLKQERAFACIHCREMKIELGHAPSCQAAHVAASPVQARVSRTDPTE